MVTQRIRNNRVWVLVSWYLPWYCVTVTFTTQPSPEPASATEGEVTPLVLQHQCAPSTTPSATSCQFPGIFYIPSWISQLLLVSWLAAYPSLIDFLLCCFFWRFHICTLLHRTVKFPLQISTELEHFTYCRWKRQLFSSTKKRVRDSKISAWIQLTCRNLYKIMILKSVTSQFLSDLSSACWCVLHAWRKTSMSHGQSRGNINSALHMRDENNFVLLCGPLCSLSVHDCHGNPSPGLAQAGGIKVGGARGSPCLSWFFSVLIAGGCCLL